MIGTQQVLILTITAYNKTTSIKSIPVVSTHSDETWGIIPDVTELGKNFPNPFNPTTTISFSIPQTSQFVKLAIYNLKGQKVTTLIGEVLPVGRHSVAWDGKDENGNRVSPGIYFYKMDTNNYSQTKKMILMK